MDINEQLAQFRKHAQMIADSATNLMPNATLAQLIYTELVHAWYQGRNWVDPQAEK